MAYKSFVTSIFDNDLGTIAIRFDEGVVASPYHYEYNIYYLFTYTIPHDFHNRDDFINVVYVFNRVTQKNLNIIGSIIYGREE